MKYVKLSEWAKRYGISYRRAWQLFKEGKIPNAKRLPGGSIVVEENTMDIKGLVIIKMNEIDDIQFFMIKDNDKIREIVNIIQGVR